MQQASDSVQLLLYQNTNTLNILNFPQYCTAKFRSDLLTFYLTYNLNVGTTV